MQNKVRITVTIDIGLAAEIDALSYPLSRSFFVNELLKESLNLLKGRRITLNDIKSPVLAKTLSEYVNSGIGCDGYA